MELAGVAVRTVVTAGMPAQELLTFIEQEQIDLAVLCSRGKVNTPRGSLGSVALRILWQSPAPVLLLQEPVGSGEVFPFLPDHTVHVLALFAGSGHAEAILTPAFHLAMTLSPQLQGHLHLVRFLASAEAYERTSQRSGQG